MNDRVVLVDEHDREIGTCPKLRAHLEGHLHRALSVCVFNRNGQLLLQRRAAGKYHSAGLWSNTCCTHPLPGEDVADAARRRLWEEMRLQCNVAHVGTVRYRLVVGVDLIEHEFDHLFIAHHDGDPSPVNDEVDDWQWVDWAPFLNDVRSRPDRYSAWLPKIISPIDKALRIA